MGDFFQISKKNWSKEKYYNTFYDGLRSRVVVGGDSDASDSCHFQVNSFVVCKCSVCTMKTNKLKSEAELKEKNKISSFRDYIKFNTVFKDLEWLYQHLTSPSCYLKGCEVNITEAVFFKNAKPQFMIKNDRDG